MTLIQHLVEHFKHPILFIGSANKSNEERNPFTFDERKNLILGQFPYLTIIPIDDLNNIPKWRALLNKNIELFKQQHGTPNSTIHFLTSGKENDHTDRHLWTKSLGHHIESVNDSFNLSATKVRNMIHTQNYDELKQSVPSNVYDFLYQKSTT